MLTMTDRKDVPDFIRKAMERQTTSILPEPSERRRLREVFSLTQDDIARELGVSAATVSTWERGRSAPTGERLKKYADLLQTLKRLEEERGSDDG